MPQFDIALTSNSRPRVVRITAEAPIFEQPGIVRFRDTRGKDVAVFGTDTLQAIIRSDHEDVEAPPDETFLVVSSGLQPNSLSGDTLTIRATRIEVIDGMTQLYDDELLVAAFGSSRLKACYRSDVGESVKPVMLSRTKRQKKASAK